MRHHRSVFIAFALFSACAGVPPMPPPPASHPASAEAEEGPIPPRSTLLSVEPSEDAAPAAGKAVPQEHAQHEKHR